METQLDLQGLLHLLRTETITPEVAASWFDRLTLHGDDLTPYMHFAQSTYTRNLIERHRKFELLLICWGKGQLTPIHDHCHSFGLMYGIEGGLSEDVYPMVPEGQAMSLAYSRDIKPGGYTIISDSIGCHQLKNVHDGPSISLHLYVKPIQYCYAYHPASARRVKRVLRYYTQFQAVNALFSI